jgi:hypothetical protein
MSMSDPRAINYAHVIWATKGHQRMRKAAATQSRKVRGAFFTPPQIADYLAKWAVANNSNARVLDPTCGEGVFLLAAGNELVRVGGARVTLTEHLFGVDIHHGSLVETDLLLRAKGLAANLIESDFFDVSTPDQLACPLPLMDAVVGNPPFVRYQLHAGNTRAKSATAALRQGVRLSGLASSWAATLVQASAFLKPEGRLAIVLPAELLSVQYAEPIRRWLRSRFGAVSLVMFERLQFDRALENVVLLMAEGSGGCEAFSLYHVADAEALSKLSAVDGRAVAFAAEGKWTDVLLDSDRRRLYRDVVGASFVPLVNYGSPELGTVTGFNGFFALSADTRQRYDLTENQLLPISPPGTRHLRGSAFTKRDWSEQVSLGAATWLLYPDPQDDSTGLLRYLRAGRKQGVHRAYKCRVRDPWWRPPAVSAPDLFFTYMSHRFPRLILNQARVSFLNSMHGIRLRTGMHWARRPLSLLALNSATMLGAEVEGRSYGGGILKMEPREAGSLPMPAPQVLASAWELICDERAVLERQLRAGEWQAVVTRVDDALLRSALGLSRKDVDLLRESADFLRNQRLHTGLRSN